MVFPMKSNPRFRAWAIFLLFATVILAAAYIIYRPVLAASGDVPLYPWGSDTLGHVYRAEYLGSAIEQGNYLPDLYPYWYLGIQLLRYYPPLPYYILSFLIRLVDNPIHAVNLFLFGAATLGSLTWYPHRRWLGWPLTLAGGLLYLLMPDNVRVAFAEGNIPRVLANMFVPGLVYLLIRSQEKKSSLQHFAGISLLIALTILSHPMMAAIFAALGSVLLAGGWISRQVSFDKAARGIIAIFVGTLLPAWWLLPSLTGGITELNSTAVARGLDVISWSTHFNPVLRLRNPEAVYAGASLLLFTLAGLLVRTARPRWVIVLASVGWLSVLITTPFFNSIFQALPLSSLLWPVRFLSMAGAVLLLASLWILSRWQTRHVWAVPAVLVIFAIDFAGSGRLIHMRPLRPEIRTISRLLSASSGWRQATLDDSRLGSAPSYFFTEEARREQVFGWAYQGARTAANVATLNEALRLGAYGYLRDRLDLMGVDDIVLLDDGAVKPGMETGLMSSGFEAVFKEGAIRYMHRDGGPRALAADWPAIGIGTGVTSYTLIFPEIVQGNSPYLDDYSFEHLKTFQKIILAGFSWHDRKAAESLAERLSAAGVEIYVDFTGTQPDPLARIPQFLGVWGEPVILSSGPLQVHGNDRLSTFGPFGEPGSLWYTFVPQGLEREVVTFDHLGQEATILGYTSVAGHPVWFLGINLIYHSLLNSDAQTIEFLSEALNLNPVSRREYRTYPLENFSPGPEGYRFSYRLEQAETLVVPVAFHDGTTLAIDNGRVAVYSLENMVLFDAPAGLHEVSITFEPPGIYRVGKMVSGFFLLIFIFPFLRDVGAFRWRADKLGWTRR